jgi:hypothetical protein
MEAEVFQQQDPAIREALELCLGLRANAVLCEGDLPSKQLSEVLRHRLEAEFFRPLASRTAQVGHQDGPRPVIHEPLYGGKALPDPAVVSYLSILQGDVEVRPHQYAFTSYVKVSDKKFRHLEILLCC